MGVASLKFMTSKFEIHKKLSTFLEIARALNRYNIIPVIFGSLGFYHLIDQVLDKIGDIDIIIPNIYLTEKFNELKNILGEIGYRQDTDYPHEFTKGEDQIGFEPESDLSDIKIEINKLEPSELEGVKFKELSLEDYLKVYKRNLATHEPKVLKIKKKIEKIKSLLAKN